MGQRANYIIKEGNTHIIYYNHWRAPQIPSDLYLGEKRFLDFVQDCQINTVIMDELWIEGCVIIDKTNRHLHFWSGDFGHDTTVHRLYLSELAKKWDGWTVAFMLNRMYDIDHLLGIDYISNQKLREVHKWSKADFLKHSEWFTTLAIIKNEKGLYVAEIGDFCTEPIIAYGKDVTDLLKTKPRIDLPKEGHDVGYETVIIDETEKHVYINLHNFGLLEQCSHLWPEYTFTMGDYGYLGSLERAGIDTTDLQMEHTEAVKLFDDLVRPRDNFNPLDMAEQILSKDDNVQFNPDFFDNVQPKKTWSKRIQQFFNRL